MSSERASHVRAALTIFPGYVFALEQQARVDAARGQLEAAVRSARRAAGSVPLPHLVSLLGDLLERRGDLVGARRQRATVAAIERLLTVNGLSVDLESAVDRADRGIRPAETVRLARLARARPAVDPRRRRARLGVGASGTVRRGRALARPCAPARDEGRSPLLPSRLCGGLRGRSRRDARLVPEGARAQPELLDPVGARGAGGGLVKRLALVAAVVARGRRRCPSAPDAGGCTPARQLHREPLRRRRAGRAAASTCASRSTLPRSRRSRSGNAVRRPGFAASSARQLELRIGGTRVPLVAGAPSRHRAGGRRGPARRSASTRSTPRRCAEASSRSPIGRYPNRIGWREITVTRGTARASGHPRRRR